WANRQGAIRERRGEVARQFQQLAMLCDHLTQLLMGEEARLQKVKFERIIDYLFREEGGLIMEAQSGGGDAVFDPGATWSSASEIIWMTAVRRLGTSSLSKHWYHSERDFFEGLGIIPPDETTVYRQYLSAVKRMVLS